MLIVHLFITHCIWGLTVCVFSDGRTGGCEGSWLWPWSPSSSSSSIWAPWCSCWLWVILILLSLSLLSFSQFVSQSQIAPYPSPLVRTPLLPDLQSQDRYMQSSDGTSTILRTYLTDLQEQKVRTKERVRDWIGAGCLSVCLMDLGSECSSVEITDSSLLYYLLGGRKLAAGSEQRTQKLFIESQHKNIEPKCLIKWDGDEQPGII